MMMKNIAVTAILVFSGLLLNFRAAAQLSNLNAVEMANSSVGYIVGTGGTILRTTDGGLDWDRLTSTTSRNLYDVDFSDANTGAATGGDALTGGNVITRTVNGGSGWTNQATGVTTPLTGIAFPTSSLGIAVGNNGTILRTQDGGASWNPVSGGTTDALKKVCFVNSATGFIVGWNGTILRTDDGGLSWTKQSVVSTTIFYDVDFTDVNNGTVVGYQGAIFRTTNGGTTWVAQSSGTGESLYGVSFAGPTTGTIVGSTGLILRTTDGGANWVRQSAGTYQNLNGVMFVSATTGLVVGGGETILRTNDGGASWSVRSVGGSSGTPPSPPALSSPANGATDLGTTVTFIWYGSSGASGYHLQVSASSSFSELVADYPGLGGSAQTIAGLSGNTTYYWRVSAFNSYGTSGWSSVWSFTTEAPPLSVPEAPVLALPGDASSGHPTTAAFSWNPSSGATEYRLQVATRSNFRNNAIIHDNGSVSTNGSTVSGLSSNTTYYWRVSASNALGTSDWSAVWGFSTGSVVSAPAVVTDAASSVAPDGATLNGRIDPNGGATTAWFEWGTASSLSSYASTSPQSVGSGDGTVPASFALTGLSEATVYYFRAAAQNSAGTVRGEITSFTTMETPTGPVFSVDPASLDFGTVQVGESSTLPVTVTNPGISALTVAVTVTGSVTFTSAPGSFSVPSGGSRTVSVTFTPTAKATETGHLVFSHDGPGSPDSVFLTGRGNTRGKPRPGSKSVKYVSSYIQDEPEVSFPLYNDGDGEVYVSSLTVSGASLEPQIDDPLVPSGDSRTVTVRFTGAGPDGSATGFVVLAYEGLPDVDSVFVDFRSAVGGDGLSGVAGPFALAQNYPNPFNPSTAIEFFLGSEGSVRLAVYDTRGAEVAVLIDGPRNAGTHRVAWDAAGLPSGVYFYRLDGEGFTSVKSMLLMK